MTDWIEGIDQAAAQAQAERIAADLCAQGYDAVGIEMDHGAKIGVGIRYSEEPPMGYAVKAPAGADLKPQDVINGYRAWCRERGLTLD
jgi:hypothetical protein